MLGNINLGLCILLSIMPAIITHVGSFLKTLITYSLSFIFSYLPLANNFTMAIKYPAPAYPTPAQKPNVRTFLPFRHTQPSDQICQRTKEIKNATKMLNLLDYKTKATSWCDNTRDPPGCWAIRKIAREKCMETERALFAMPHNAD